MVQYEIKILLAFGYSTQNHLWHSSTESDTVFLKNAGLDVYIRFQIYVSTDICIQNL